MHMRPFPRLTNGFSKKFENHAHLVALYAVFYNFTKIHKSLHMSPAMSAGLSKTLLDVVDIVAMLDAAEDPIKKRGAYKKAAANVD